MICDSVVDIVCDMTCPEYRWGRLLPCGPCGLRYDLRGFGFGAFCEQRRKRNHNNDDNESKVHHYKVKHDL